LALELKDKGFENVKVVLGGWQAMIKAGFPYVFRGKVNVFQKKSY
jgi:rhodanese-related sulfurtransferase